MKKSVKDVNDYIKQAPSWAKGILREMRKVIKAAVPKASESISYHQPYYSYYGRLAYLGAFTNHCSFFWIGSDDKKKYKKELASQRVVGNTLQIPRGAKVPVGLIKKIVKARAKSNEARKK